MSVVSEVMADKKICPFTTRQIVDIIVQFIELINDVPLYTYQSLFARRIVESVLDCDGAVITGLWARQSGKTETIADTALGLAVFLPALGKAFPDDPRLNPYKKGFRVGIYAPISDQAKISFDRMRNRVAGSESERVEEVMSDPELDVELVTDRSDTLAFSNGSLIVAKSASPDAQIEGATWHLLILEECQKISRAKVDKELRPMLAATNGTTVKIGTAWESRGGFHVSIQQNVELHNRGGKRNHFEFPYDIVISEKRRAYEQDGKVAHLNYEKFVEQEKAASGGEASAEFRMNFMCLWQESRVIAVRSTIFYAASIPDLESGPTSWGFQVGGLDVGKVTDPTVLTLLDIDLSRPITNYFRFPGADAEEQVSYPKKIIDWVEMYGSFEGETGQYRELVEYLLRTNIKVLCIDATAIGDPVFERIQVLLGDDVVCVPYKYGSVSKSHLFKYYLTELHSGRVRYCGGPQTRTRYEYMKFQTEHIDLDKVDVGGYSVCQAPEGGHDDYPNSAALACWAEKVLDEVIVPEIEMTSAPEGGALGRRGYGDQRFMGQEMGSKVEELMQSNGHRAGRYQRRWG